MGKRATPSGIGNPPHSILRIAKAPGTMDIPAKDVNRKIFENPYRNVHDCSAKKPSSGCWKEPYRVGLTSLFEADGLHSFFSTETFHANMTWMAPESLSKTPVIRSEESIVRCVDSAANSGFRSRAWTIPFFLNFVLLLLPLKCLLERFRIEISFS